MIIRLSGARRVIAIALAREPVPDPISERTPMPPRTRWLSRTHRHAPQSPPTSKRTGPHDKEGTCE